MSLGMWAVTSADRSKMYSHPRYVNEQRIIFTRRYVRRLEMTCYALALACFAAAGAFVVYIAPLID
jgi:hypothetical protein